MDQVLDYASQIVLQGNPSRGFSIAKIPWI